MAHPNQPATRSESRRREDTARTNRPSNRRRKIVVATFVAVLALLVAGISTGAATRMYAIVYGDTLNDIAAKHGTDVATLVGLNNIDDPDMIIAGDELSVPDGDLVSYTVREGDTLADIAASYGVSASELIAVNKIADADMIHTGEVLLVYVAANHDENQSDAEPADSDPVPDPIDQPDSVSEESPEVDSETMDSAPEEPSVSGRLHLVQDNETLADIAAAYGVTETQLIAANALESTELSAGMILKIPTETQTGVELIGMPSGQEQWPLMSELAAVSIATAYWGAPVSAEELLAALDRSDNPHLGFRGDPYGMFGTTDDYGVYNLPLAAALNEMGFNAEAFYSDGDRSVLTSRIDAGTPVVVWITHNLAINERTVVDDELGRYSLIPEQHAVVVYGYDDNGVDVMDVGTGVSANWDWDAFIASWSLFDGMGLAIDLG